MSEPEQPEAPPPDQVEVALSEIEGATDEDLRGPDRLGSLAFDEADVGVMREIASVLKDAKSEDRSYWSSGRQAELNDHATAITNLIGQVKTLRADDENAAGRRGELQNALRNELTWLRETIVPILIDKRINEAISRLGPDSDANVRTREEIRRVTEENSRRLQELIARLNEVEPAVEATRAAGAVTGAEDLSAAYADSADKHAKAWKRWLKVLVVTGILTAVAGVLILWWNHPTGDFNAQAVTHLLADLFLLGLLLYAVRVASLQFRVHRHLEAKDRSKAAALTTFSRIVASGTEASTRDVLAQTLAQSVFEAGDTGFVDSSSDQITLIERVIGPVTQRATGS